MARIQKIKTEDLTLSGLETDLLIMGYDTSKALSDHISSIDGHIFTNINSALEIEEFDGKFGNTLNLYGNDKVKRILIAGIGDREKFNEENARDLGAKLVQRANRMKIKKLHVDAISMNISESDLLQAFIEGAVLGGYEFTEYKTVDNKGNTLTDISLLNCKDAKTALKAKKIADAVLLARDVSNHPANVATPEYLAEEAEKLGKYDNFEVEIFDVSQFESMGLGAFYGVARGSKRPGKLIIIKYSGAGDKQPFALVGKGLTFDTGGISLKPSANMDEMKFDMCGSSTVLGVMKAVGELQPEINLVAAIGATENMPGGFAQLPGDIVKAYNGKTIEILNTDAEGRLVLADVLSYVVDKFKPSGILDFATLTGAVLVTLGHRATGIMGNNPDLIQEVKSAGETTGEKVWELPLWDEYAKDIKSKIADVKNMGAGRTAGTIAGGIFLKEFVGDTPWCHLDIAGTAWGVKEPSYQPSTGATGVGVRMVYKLIENRAK